MAGELKLNNVSVATESGGVVSLSAANTLAFPAGHIVQVQTKVHTSTLQGWTNATWTSTGLSINITPKLIYTLNVCGPCRNQSILEEI